jgi:uncharacterized protein YjdB
MMTKNFLRSAFYILHFTFYISLLLPSCKEEKEDAPAHEEVRVTGVSLDKKAAALDPDSTVQLTAIVTPENADSPEVTWRSTAETVATVSQAGRVTAVAEGTALVVVTTVDGEFADTCTVTVAHIAVPVTGVSLDANTVTLAPKLTVELTATVTPQNADFPDVTWRSTANTVATVSLTGRVTAVAAGRASIIATTVNGGFTDTCTVTVVQPVTGVSLDVKAAALKPASTVQFTAAVKPEDTDFPDITWHSTAQAVATVTQTGRVTAVAEGAASIVVTTVDGGFTDTCTVTVADIAISVTGVSLDTNTVTLDPERTVQLTATVTPADADFPEVTWHSTREIVATVSQTGLVTAMTPGTTSIVATASNGQWTDTCIVTVLYKLIADLNPPAEPELLDPTPPNGAYWEHGNAFKLWEHKDGYGHGVKITIVGESFSREDNGNDGIYEAWCKKMASRLLKNDIIRNFRNYIDISVAVAESPVSRINETTPGFFGTTTTRETNFGKANTFTVTAIPELAGVLNRSYILIANGMMGGWALFGLPAGNGGAAWWSTAMGSESNNDISTYWMMHEFIGHGFASLADEYPGATGSYDFNWQRSGMVNNVSKTSDPTSVPWNRFIGLEGYSEVSVYQVCYGRECDRVWRPERHSIMVDDADNDLYYNAQSRWLIYKHIYDCSKFLDNQSGNSTAKPKIYAPGEGDALFEAFLEFDKMYNVK